MNSLDREQLRLSLLRFLDANARGQFGLSEGLLHQLARAEGRPELVPADITRELQYLADKEMVTEVRKAISPENRAWRITATGRDHFASL